MSNLSKAERDKLPAADFADEAHRLFPILDSEDVEKAAHLVGKAANPAAVKKKIIAIAKKKNLSLPTAWKDTADMSDDLAYDFLAEFGEDKGETVVRPAAKIFVADLYKFKNAPDFLMTPEDIMETVVNFSPVEIDDNHRPTHGPDGNPVPPSFFKGKLGSVISLKPSDDFTHFGGEIEFPKWLDALYKDKPIPLSATWDRNTKQLKNVAITHNPRIVGAEATPAAFANLPTADAIFSALAEEEARRAVNPTPAVKPPEPPAVDPVVPAVASFAKSAMTPHGMGALQAAHDIAARAGAVCGAAKKTADMTADFTTQGEHDNLQKIHDAATSGGAACRTMPAGTDPAGPMMASYAAEFAAVAMTPKEKELQAKLDAMEAARAAEQKAAQTAQFSADVVSGKSRGEAAFAELFRRGAATPAEKAGLVGEYTQAVLDDLIDRQAGKSPEVQFSVDGGAYQNGSREDAVKARWKARPESVLLKQLDEAEFTVLADNDKLSAQKAQEKAGDELANRV